jgi:N-methylhydantoinase B/oxoprolinase/acetone carboxylase alpha subunit
VRIVRRELRTDTGGPGRYRGGLGQVIELESAEDAPMAFFAAVDRVHHPARGRHGGLPGACGRLALSSGRLLSGKGEQLIPAGERLIFETPGGGGYGDPSDRPADELAADVRRGWLTPEAARAQYGAEI